MKLRQGPDTCSSLYKRKLEVLDSLKLSEKRRTLYPPLNISLRSQIPQHPEHRMSCSIFYLEMLL